jgi:hypothetical protein
MKSNRVLAAAIVAVTCFALVATASAGVLVGSSSLIGTLDYSDTFTAGTTRVAGEFPMHDPAVASAVENCYGNSQVFWNYESRICSFGNIVDDATVYSPSDYPGSNGVGSATGFTQRGSGGDYGIAYGHRSNYVVQFDAVQDNDRIDIATGSANDGISSSDGLTVFFRATGSAFAEIGLYNPTVGETSTGFASHVTARTWHNYAVGFNLEGKTLSLYTDEALRGTIDLTTFAGGAYANVLDANTNQYVIVGASGNDCLGWSDNFQVGSVVPEPTSLVSLVIGCLGLIAYAWKKRS